MKNIQPRKLNTRQPADQNSSNKRSLALIFSVILMDVIGITLLSPVAPQIVMRYSDSALMVTMIMVIYASGQFVAAPLLGKIGDKIGRRPVLLLSLLGQAVGYFVFGLGGALWVLFLGRLIGGITSGNISTSTAYIADISKPEERSKNFAMIATAWSLGLILGPALGGAFGEISLETPAIVAGIVTLLNVILGFFFLPESLSEETRDTSPISLRDYNPLASIGDMARKPGVGLLLVVYGLFYFAFNGVNSISALFVLEKFTAETWQVSLMMVLNGAVLALSNTFLIPRLVPTFGERAAAISGLLGMGIIFTGVFFSPIFWIALMVNMVGGIMNALVFPTLTTLSVERVSTRESGRLLGVTSAVGSLMNIFGPIWAGLVYDHVLMGSPYWMGTIVLFLAAWMLSRTPPQERRVPLAPQELVVEK